MKLSVVIPAYNEAQRILPSLQQICTYLESRHPGFEIVVVDDGSTDGTAAVIAEGMPGRDVLHVLSYAPNRGKGYALRYGTHRARGDLVLLSDADLSTPITEIEKMLPLIGDGCDMVIGSRAHAQAEIRKRQPFYREGAGKLFNVLVRLVVGGPFRDTQCGFKLFRRDAVVPLLPHLRIDRWAFDVELIAFALAAGLEVAEVPVVWINSPMTTVSLGGGARAFLDLVRIRHRVRRLHILPIPSGKRAEVAGGRR
jgi:dolichyl-phosphate beta-glucosyltransferase